MQVALCTLLLISAGLFVKTFAKLTQLDPGFKKTGLLLFTLEPPQQRYPSPKNIEVLHRIEERLPTLPGVDSATLSQEALLAQSGSNSDFIPLGRPLDPSRQRYIAFNSVGQSFFKTMGISILNGRQFDNHDTSTSPAVALINRALAQKEFPGMNPLGSTFPDEGRRCTHRGRGRVRGLKICLDPARRSPGLLRAVYATEGSERWHDVRNPYKWQSA